MDNLLVIGIILAMMIVLLLAGLYIHSVLLASGIIGLILLEGFGILPGLLGNEPFNRVASYTLTTIPLFVLMAQFILQSGLVQDIFYMVRKVSKGKNSLLGVLTLIIGGLLGAVSGSGTATSASLGQVAIPELRKHGYSAPLAGAVAASGGSLSGIIPPSIILILYGVATETPVGSLFVGAFIPGILTMLVFIAVMLVYFQLGKKKQQSAQEEVIEETATEEKVPVLRLIIASVIAVAIVFIIFGGIYSGVFTPTEAGAVGAFVGLIAAFLLGKVNFAFFKTSLIETVKLTGMVMIIMIGAQIFGRFVSLSLLPRRLIEWIEPIMDTPALVLIAISIVLFIMFMFIEGAAVILMSIPVLLPIIVELQVDILWFGVFVAVICTIGLITPPVGLSVYAVAGVSGISSGSIFRLTTVFALVAMVVVTGLMIAFPGLATWLPNSM
ncbi:MULTISPECIES: TRAP transporter large permease [unclassified Planococcus (in: firmicutes)]|uniref:TRAP transporter large permease n=1 Tax=unclassified Planococcus (in: firmicutes) TaxID=2662419 RepID=UPI000C32FFCB|nr:MULTISPECIES: TRAP transporter large permease [unclassified Planococcus (in: firmicutes)]AUD14763.1 TRAP transporter large permease [Planococcus sp. MB-3u-03]PKG45074.1 TRAP transporter large permease [Planococcus sp. Urea-trap-24]PKG87417.1 TRAP transporter large permease [Planococcus sp. Urea-3u-39]PKH42542.1 TRAP transporter large permease [Planococcus sp. MB-3u-09]